MSWFKPFVRELYEAESLEIFYPFLCIVYLKPERVITVSVLSVRICLFRKTFLKSFLEFCVHIKVELKVQKVSIYSLYLSLPTQSIPYCQHVIWILIRQLTIRNMATEQFLYVNISSPWKNDMRKKRTHDHRRLFSLTTACSHQWYTLIPAQ